MMPLFYYDFRIPILGYGQLDHIKSQNCGPETIGSILRAPGLKNSK